MTATSSKTHHLATPRAYTPVCAASACRAPAPAASEVECQHRSLVAQAARCQTYPATSSMPTQHHHCSRACSTGGASSWSRRAHTACAPGWGGLMGEKGFSQLVDANHKTIVGCVCIGDSALLITLKREANFAAVAEIHLISRRSLWRPPRHH